MEVLPSGLLWITYVDSTAAAVNSNVLYCALHLQEGFKLQRAKHCIEAAPYNQKNEIQQSVGTLMDLKIQAEE